MRKTENSDKRKFRDLNRLLLLLFTDFSTSSV